MDQKAQHPKAVKYELYGMEDKITEFGHQNKRLETQHYSVSYDHLLSKGAILEDPVT